jgi:hypothetical protein
MDELEAKRCHEALLKYIGRTGEEKVKAISRAAKEEYDSMRAKYISEEKDRIINEYNVRLKQDEIKLKI